MHFIMSQVPTRPNDEESATSRTPILSTGWLRPLINADEISEDSHELVELVAAIEQETDRSAELQAAQEELKDELKAMAALLQKRNAPPTDADAKSLRHRLKLYRKRAGKITQKTCRVLLHYQQVFDVLNSQAPEYTTAIWGATKLLLLVVCNDVEVQEKLETHLESFIASFQSLDLVTQFRPTKRVQEYVTEATKNFLSFLREAIKYYGEGSFRLVKPWPTRFQSLVDGVLASIATARECTQAEFQVETRLLLRRIDKSTELLQQKLDHVREHQVYESHPLNELLEIVAPLRGVDLTSIGKVNEHAITAAFEQLKVAVEANHSQSQPVPEIQLQPPEEAPSSVTTQAQKYTRVRNAHDDDKATSRAGQITFGSKFSRADVPVISLLSNQQSTHASLSGVFDGIEEMEQPLEELLVLLRHDAEESSHAVQNLDHNRAVGNWVTQPAPCMLWLTGFRGYGSANWMTSFALRMLYAVAKREVVYLYAFCDNFGQHQGATARGPVSTTRIAQSLVTQLVGHLAGHLSWVESKLGELTAQRFRQSQDQTEELFAILHQLLDMVGPPNVFVVVDSVHRLLGAGSGGRHRTRDDDDDDDGDDDEGSSSSRQVAVFFRGLLDLTTNVNSRVKILVTSWPPARPENLLDRRSLRHPNLCLVKIPPELTEPLPAESLWQQSYRLPAQSPRQQSYRPPSGELLGVNEKRRSRRRSLQENRLSRDEGSRGSRRSRSSTSQRSSRSTNDDSDDSL